MWSPPHGARKNKKFKVECPTTYLSTITFENGTIINFIYDYNISNEDKSSLSLKWPESINYDLSNTIFTNANVTLTIGDNENALTMNLQLMYLNNKWSISPISEGRPINVNY